MKKKLNCILLVDDDDDCNFFHKRLFKQMDCVEKVEIATDGQEALDFLISTNDGKHPQPQIILLDINMPVMNGWEFLDEYEKLEASQKAEILLVMLTTSLNPDDRERAKSHSSVGYFQNKLLQEEQFLELLKVHFPDYF
ncbi:CheY chemotaxis protein or a CheY-like REC (receiver) domain [Reichenbachiella faecimaris]|uniref:CheY chemotaxis protein or a CheY-like REC (Receiver) domain n=1 Tax=Reichenbachiella faecimaris TaxID=692418 RepID=A0A1W2GH75_REIFA|nr:response regulator [Reichenbachiella faecimaris]SMD36009.1 CheY chemotaxis protein or a CheY-like REC (receiver) domain [Reichenbachiella faecimaris]